MKTLQYKNNPEVYEHLDAYDLAHLFHVDLDSSRLDATQVSYNLNRTIQFNNVDKTPRQYFEEYDVRLNDTWLTISYEKYGTTKLWWLLCKINGIINPVNDPEAGIKVKILNVNYVQNVLNEIKR